MGTSKQSQVGKGLENDGEKWVFAEISIRASLKPVKTKQRESEAEEEEDYNGSEEFCVTPTKKGAKTPEKLKCPAAPKKRRPALKCRSNVGIEYFVPPEDLETVFIRRR
ncbi:Cyclin-dependent protein kinase inhibitor SMR7 [Cardamine amara subsp. amara]|uniref:Cyclin-dependent protein kinase inhibitor SMR7 n=1 Tax=Cardamine amara subsp. amara TaxID=228776 RepID=A0ABD1AFA0_CARAN